MIQDQATIFLTIKNIFQPIVYLIIIKTIQHYSKKQKMEATFLKIRQKKIIKLKEVNIPNFS
jgi:hypothetical protein